MCTYNINSKYPILCYAYTFNLLYRVVYYYNIGLEIIPLHRIYSHNLYFFNLPIYTYYYILYCNNIICNNK